MNIVINARQALPDTGGHVTIRTGVAGDYVFINVHDTGKGIPADVMPLVTEPFFTTKGENGSGLGLSVARKVVGCHEGRVEFDSVEGEGTTVSIKLPVAGTAPEEREDTEIPKPARPQTRVPQVLVIEDDPEMLTNIKMSLVGMGYTAEGAREAGEGLEQFESYLRDLGEAPRVVITDLHMPGLLGTELARRIKKIAPDTRIILISGYITEEATQVTSPHVDVIIKKPFRFPDLARHLKLDRTV